MFRIDGRNLGRLRRGRDVIARLLLDLGEDRGEFQPAVECDRRAGDVRLALRILQFLADFAKGLLSGLAGLRLRRGQQIKDRGAELDETLFRCRAGVFFVCVELDDQTLDLSFQSFIAGRLGGNQAAN